MQSNGYQPRLLDQYLFHKRRGPAVRPGLRPTYGTIKKLVNDRGFGFIRPEGGTQDLFFHRSSVEAPSFEELKEGDPVEFNVERDHLHNENQAVKIRVAQKPADAQNRKLGPRRNSVREYRSLEYRSMVGTSRALNEK